MLFSQQTLYHVVCPSFVFAILKQLYVTGRDRVMKALIDYILEEG